MRTRFLIGDIAINHGMFQRLIFADQLSKLFARTQIIERGIKQQLHDAQRFSRPRKRSQWRDGSKVCRAPAKQLGGFYRRRWSIEVFFQSVKERGFNLENTHLKSSDKIKKLLVFVSIAAGICINVGKRYHGKVQKIRIKKHGYKSNSFFRKVLDILREGFRKPSKKFTKMWEDILNIFTRWVQIQLSHYQDSIKIIG